MRIVFFGTPYYVVPILNALNKAFKEKTGESPVEAVVTQPPKPMGRKKMLQYSPVDDWAHKKGIKKFFDPNEIILGNVKADLGILASYGEIIPEKVINYFPKGILVVHPSLLPEFRWSSPVPAAIVANASPTGVTIIKMDDKFDHGPIVAQFKEEIKEDDTYGTLRDRLFANSAEVLVQALPAYLKGKIKLRPQDDAKATFARIIKKEGAFIPPKFLEAALTGSNPVKKKWKIDFVKNFEAEPTHEFLDRFIRAMDPWPGAWTLLRTSATEGQAKRLKILKAHIEKNKLVLDEVQLEGKNTVTWEEFKRGYPEAKLV